MAAPPAGASVTQTKILSSTIAAYELIDGTPGSPAPVRTLSGSSDGSAADLIDLKARTSDGLVLLLASGIPVSSGGSWTWTGSISPLAATVPSDPANPLTARRIKALSAVPAASATASPGSAKWPGSSFTIDVWNPVQDGGRSHPSDFLFSGVGSLAWSSYNGFDSCGLCDGGLTSSDGAKGSSLWVWNASVDGPDQARTDDAAGTRTPSISIDGKAAYASFFANALADPAASRPRTHFTRTVDASTGATTLTEHHPLVSCAEFPVRTPADCPSLLDTGATLNRTVRIAADGSTSRIDDTVVSSDGASHTWEIHYINAIKRGSGGVAWMLPGARQWSLAKPPASQPEGQSDWTVTRGLTSPTTIQARSSVRSPASPSSPAGSITVSPRPLRLWFPRASSDRLSIDMGGTVPAAGASAISFTYAVSTRPSTSITGIRPTAAGLFVWVRTDRPGMLSLRASTANRPIVAVCNAPAVAVPKGVSRLLCRGPASTVRLATKGTQLNLTIPFTASPWAEVRNSATAPVG